MMERITISEANVDWFVLLSLFVFLFLIGAETYLISPILPQVAAELSTTVRYAAYIVTAYVLAYALLAGLAHRNCSVWQYVAKYGLGWFVFGISTSFVLYLSFSLP